MCARLFRVVRIIFFFSFFFIVSNSLSFLLLLELPQTRSNASLQFNRQYEHQIGTCSEHATLTVPRITQEELLGELSKTDASAAAVVARECTVLSAVHTVAAPPPGVDLKVVAKAPPASAATTLTSLDGQVNSGEVWFYESLWRGGKQGQDKERFVKEQNPPPLQLAAFVPKFLGFHEQMY